MRVFNKVQLLEEATHALINNLSIITFDVSPCETYVFTYIHHSEDEMFTLHPNDEYHWTIEEARDYWKSLVSKHGYTRIK